MTTDRHKTPRPDRHKYKDWEFTTLDGEGSVGEPFEITVKKNGKNVQKVLQKSIYQVLAAYVPGEGMRSIEDTEGLSTVRCLEFLLDLPRRSKLANVGYGFNYDICNILKDTPHRKLKELAEDNPIGIYVDRTHRYRVRVVYTKSIEVWKMQKTGRKWRTVKYARVYDAIGFFQTSFLKAIEEYKVGTTEELKIIDHYKARRGEDLEEDWEGWKGYNATECRLLSAMMGDFAGLLKAENIKVSHWWGAGAIAGAWYKENDIRQYMPFIESEGEKIHSFGEPIDKMIKQAYFGGQVQRLKVGIFKVPVWRYDLCSAYPWALSKLPTLIGAWRETDRFEPENEWALYDVDWDFTSIWQEVPYGALPWRCKNGGNVYPRQGNGIFWYWEVAAVMNHWPQCIKIRKGHIFEPESDVKPFAWVVDKFNRRNELKQAKNPRNIPLKLGLNSLYGKLAQGEGMKDSRGKRIIPAYQSWFWAGNITAMTRGRMIDAVARDPQSIISIATDGIYSLAPLDISTGIDLGDWMQEPTLDSFELYGNGIYRGKYITEEGEEKELKKARGVRDREFDFEGFGNLFKQQDLEGVRRMKFTYKVRRFYGYKIAVKRNHPEMFCCWGEEERESTIIGFDCFEPRTTPLPHVYQIECTFGKNAGRVKPAKRKEPRIYDPPGKPFSIETATDLSILEAEQASPL